MNAVLVDTSVFVEAERRNLQALERLHGLMAADALAVSVVTVAELLAGQGLSRERRRFYGRLFQWQAMVLDVSVEAGDCGVAAAREAGSGTAPDILIAGTAIEHGLKVLTFDAGLARLLGPSAELLRVA